MDHSPHRTTSEWEVAVGAQVRSARIAGDHSQSELAALADVSIGAVRNLEAGEGSSLRTVVRVVRALGRTSWLEALSPAVTISPIAVAAARSKAPRRRVSRRAGT